MFRYERRGQILLPRGRYLLRVLAHFTLAAGLVAVSLVLGMAGYVRFERLSWTDAFLESAMLLGGMGPVHTPVSQAGKVFAGVFALYAGLLFLVVAAIMIGPVVHRILHRFHWDQKE